jgi:heterodisulfide reductase subunit A
LHLKEANPDIKVYILYRDIMSYGFMETYFTKARQAGIIFIRYEMDKKPVVDFENGRPQITATDHVLGHSLVLRPDLLVLSTGIIPEDQQKLAEIWKLPTDEDGFFLEGDSKWRPVEFLKRGFFTCGMAHSPRFIGESIAMAEAAAQRALKIISKDRIAVSSVVARVDERLCTSCKTCVGVCVYEAITFSEQTKTASVNDILCQGCGNCAASCPVMAIRVQYCEPEQVFSQIEEMLA